MAPQRQRRSLQPFPDPIGGFTRGLTGGLRLGVGLKERGQKRLEDIEARQTQIKKDKFDKGIKLLKAATDAEAIGTLAGRKRAFELGNLAAEALGFPASTTKFDDTKDFSAVSKEVRNAIGAFEGNTTAGGDRGLLESSLQDAYSMARDVLTPAQVTELKTEAKAEVGAAETRLERSMLGQVARIPGLEKEGVITSEQAAEARIVGLERAGAPGAEILKQEQLRVGAATTSTQISNELALAMFGKQFNELEQPQKQAVLAARQERAVEVGAAREKAKIEVRKDAPLSSTDLQRFVNPETLEKFPAGTTLADVEKVGGFSATPKQLEDITSLDQEVTIVNVLDQLSANLNTIEVGPLALAHGARLSAGAFAGTNPIARAYRDQKEQFLSLLARTFGERGVLTDRDIGRISVGLPSFGDTKDVRDFKIGTVKLLFDVAAEARKRVITGKKPTTEQKKRITELVANLASEGAAVEENVPKGLPEGAFKIGTSGGKAVYQTPDGKKFIED